MPQTQDMTPHQSQYTDRESTFHWAIHWTTHWNTKLLPVLMSWVRTDQEFLALPSTHDAVMVVVSQKFGIKGTVPTDS